MKKYYIIALFLPCMITAQVGQPPLPSSYETLGARPVRGAMPIRTPYSVRYGSPHGVATKTFIGTGRTITDYAIRANDKQLMRLLGVNPAAPVKPAEDTAALEKIAIEQAVEYNPEPGRFAVVNEPATTEVALQENPVAVEVK